MGYLGQLKITPAGKPRPAAIEAAPLPKTMPAYTPERTSPLRMSWGGALTRTVPTAGAAVPVTPALVPAWQRSNLLKDMEIIPRSEVQPPGTPPPETLVPGGTVATPPIMPQYTNGESGPSVDVVEAGVGGGLFDNPWLWLAIGAAAWFVLGRK